MSFSSWGRKNSFPRRSRGGRKFLLPSEGSWRKGRAAVLTGLGCAPLGSVAAACGTPRVLSPPPGPSPPRARRGRRLQTGVSETPGQPEAVPPPAPAALETRSQALPSAGPPLGSGGPFKAAKEALVGWRRPVTSFGWQLAAAGRRKKLSYGGGHVPSPRGGRRTRNRSTQFLMTPLISYTNAHKLLFHSATAGKMHTFGSSALFSERDAFVDGLGRRPLSKNLKFEALEWLLNVNCL